MTNVRVPYGIAWKRAALELRRTRPGLTDEREILTEMGRLSGQNEEGLGAREADELLRFYRQT